MTARAWRYRKPPGKPPLVLWRTVPDHAAAWLDETGTRVDFVPVPHPRLEVARQARVAQAMRHRDRRARRRGYGRDAGRWVALPSEDVYADLVLSLRRFRANMTQAQRSALALADALGRPVVDTVPL